MQSDHDPGEVVFPGNYFAMTKDFYYISILVPISYFLRVRELGLGGYMLFKIGQGNLQVRREDGFLP